MTRFLLPLKEAIDLVAFALEKGRQGDIFVRKAPSCLVGDLAQAVKNIFRSNSEIKTIGMRQKFGNQDGLGDSIMTPRQCRKQPHDLARTQAV